MAAGVRVSIQGAGGGPMTFDVDREIIIGRATSADIRLPFSFVSSRHLRIFEDQNAWMVEDLGSTNGTMVADTQMRPNVPLRITAPLCLKIQSVRVEISPTASAPAQYTLALSGSIARHLAAEFAGPSTNAFIEVKSGPSAGLRIDLEDAGGSVTLTVIDADVQLAPDGEIAISKQGEGFVWQRGDEVRELKSEDRIDVDGVTLVFIDPLESLLKNEEGIEPGAEPTPTETVETSTRPLPWVAIVGLAIVAALAIGILAVFLT